MRTGETAGMMHDRWQDRRNLPVSARSCPIDSSRARRVAPPHARRA
jgi:hypothetical protein